MVNLRKTKVSWRTFKEGRRFWRRVIAGRTVCMQSAELQMTAVVGDWQGCMFFSSGFVT